MTRRRQDQAFRSQATHAQPTHGRRVRAWLNRPLSALDQTDPADAAALQAWLLRATDDGVAEFGIQCPTVTLVTALEDHMDLDQDLTPPFCMLGEAIRQKDALSRIASRVANDDLLYETLMAPIMEVDASGTAVIDAALLILMGAHYGKATDAFWRVVTTWHQQQFGTAPNLSKQTFLTRVTLH